MGHLKYYDLRKVHKLYYARFNADSTLSQRPVLWRRASSRDSIPGKYYTQILAKDYDNYKLFYKTKSKACDLCADEEKILYLEQKINEKVIYDPIIYKRGYYKFPLLRPNKVRVKIYKRYITNPDEYFEDSLKLERVVWKEPKWRKKGYYHALLPVTRNEFGRKIGPVVYRSLIHCPYETPPTPPAIFVDPNSEIGNYFSGFKADYGFHLNQQKQFYSLGYHKRFKRQSINLSLQYTSENNFFPRIQYQFYLLNFRHYKHLFFYEPSYIRSQRLIRKSYLQTYTQLYIGTEYFTGKVNEEWISFQRIYLGVNKQLGYLNLYANTGFSGIFNQLPRTSTYLEIGIKLNIPPIRSPRPMAI